ncbi:MAG: NADH-quinone oxidoreductase subunit M [Nitrososphaeraceae archaeon]|nr:NADH-quinone oxidoreductase subunit M [Nitrososphaeraceae archaeon]MDW0151244.1 NADH-quinone oxidoreductase subunit M [Nitrososphaeraceae archaeon]
MTESYYLLVATFLPLLVSPVAYVLAKKSGSNATTWFSFGILAISTLLLFMASSTLQGGRSAYIESYTWSQFGNFGLRIDGLSLPFAIIINILCTVLTLYSKPYMLHKIKESFKENFNNRESNSGSNVHTSSAGGNEIESLTISGSNEEQYVNHHMGLYFALYLTFSMGMLGTVLATNLIEFYVFFELMLVPAFFLVAFYGYGERKRIALMFFFWTHVGAVVLLLGLLAMGFFAGGFDYDTVMENVGKIPDQWLVLIVFSLVIGLGVKLAAFLLHIWLPYAHSEAPTPISALLSPAMIGIGAYGLLRLWLELLVGDYSQYSIYINLWGLATMIYGGAMALMQDDIKRVLAYSSISQMGYILFGLGSESVLGITGAALMYVSHGLGKAILFMMAGSIILQTGTRSMSKLGGLAGRMPYTAVIAMIGALTIMGIPPTSGFMAEWILFNGVLQSGVTNSDTLRIVAFGLGILATVLTAAYILWMYKRIFFGKIPEQYSQIKDSNRYVIVTMAALAAITLFLGVYPNPLLNPVTDYIQEMFSTDNTVLQFSNVNPVSLSYQNDSNGLVAVAGGGSSL